MSCSNCSKTKKILSCTTVLTVGTTNLLSTALFIYLKSYTTGRVYKFTSTSSEAGLITVTLSAQQFAEAHDYEIWITLATATNIEDKVNFTIDGETVNCLSVQFKRVYDNDNALNSGAQTLSLED